VYLATRDEALSQDLQATTPPRLPEVRSGRKEAEDPDDSQDERGMAAALLVIVFCSKYRSEAHAPSPVGIPHRALGSSVVPSPTCTTTW